MRKLKERKRQAKRANTKNKRYKGIIKTKIKDKMKKTKIREVK